MKVKPNSQNARVLRVLADGKWKSSAAITRKSGATRLNSRLAELRAHGFQIEHRPVPGKTGPLAHKFRMLNPPSLAELATVIDIEEEDLLARDEVPRTPAHRYRVYRMAYDKLGLMATATTSADVGDALIALGAEGDFGGYCVGILDTHGSDETQGTWVVNPFDTTRGALPR